MALLNKAHCLTLSMKSLPIFFSHLLILVIYFVGFSILHAQQKLESYVASTASYFEASSAYTQASQHYLLLSTFPNLEKFHAEAWYNQVKLSALRNSKVVKKELDQFLVLHPTTNLSENTTVDIANLYFAHADYSKSMQWFDKTEDHTLFSFDRPAFNFKKAYSYFSGNQYKLAKPYFEKLTQTIKYATDANYYLGFIAYQFEEYEAANDNFAKLTTLKDRIDIRYFQSNMYFNAGDFERAIELGKASLVYADPIQYSELSKIIGESYFNLGDYKKALTYLLDYKGKNGRWSNTDYYQLGYVYYRLTSFSKAIEQFNRIIEGEDEIAQNAYYHLADSYLKTNQQTAALNAFKRASEMAFDLFIREDALLNYARLSYSLGNSYERPSTVIERFLSDYPSHKEASRMESLLLDYYMVTQNFETALALLNTFSLNRFPKERQQVFYQLASLRYRLGEFNDSIELYQSAVGAHTNSNVKALSYYWMAQAFFEIDNYSTGIDAMKNAYKQPAFNTLDEYKFYNYNIGYAYFQSKNYASAITNFELFLAQNDYPAEYESDARLRLADSYFGQGDYLLASIAYAQANKIVSEQSDYLLYQQAISNGYINQSQEKITLLITLTESFPDSDLVDDSIFEIAKIYAEQKDYTQSELYYQKLIDEFLTSELRPNALLNIGLDFFNQGKNVKASDKLRQIVVEYPQISLVQQAVQTLKEISVEQNSVEEFSEWMSNVETTTLSEGEIERAAFQAIERLIDNNQAEDAITALRDYTSRYPEGLDVLRAYFLLGELNFKKGQWEEALLSFTYVVEKQPNSYSEQAFVRMTEIYKGLDRVEEAISVWKHLEKVAKYEENRRFAQSNLMLAYYRLADYKEAIAYVELILSLDQLEDQIRWDAYYVWAKSAEALQDRPLQIMAFKELENAPQPERVVEALYFAAEEKNRNGAFENSNLIIERIAQDFGDYPYWGAKSLLLMSKNFYQLGDAFQATFILESIVKNFTQFSDLIEQANIDLAKIKAIESNQNASIKPNIDNNE